MKGSFMLKIDTERMQLIALDRHQLGLCLTDPQRLGTDLGINLSPEIFSEESRQAIGIKTTRMLLADPELHPWYTYFLLVRKEDLRAMGVAGFKGAPSSAGAVELGYAIYEGYRNQGYMTEAVRALITWAFEHKECRRVTAETLIDNHASQNVLKKSGLSLERVLENMVYWKIDRTADVDR
jgi:RimJ/RimL family protein N-acetyltransferase